MPKPPREGPAAEGRLGRRWRSRTVVVHDDSMAPVLRPGDRLYVDPRPRRPLALGDIVVVRDPEGSRRLLVKRIAGLPGTVGPADLPIPEHELYLLGDNAERSRDSRAFGPVPTAALVGVAWFRYAPAERRGSLTG